MRICYLIIAHDNPVHLKRLVATLTENGSDAFIHIDQKQSIDPFKKTLGNTSTRSVHWVTNRVPISWGGFSMVQATLNLIDAARATNERYDRYCLLSGSHYALRSERKLQAYLHGSDKEFISSTAVPNVEASKPLLRFTRIQIDKFYHKQYGLPFLFTTYFARAFNKLRLQRGYKRRLKGMLPYAGSQWWLLTDDAIDYICDFVEQNPSIVNFFRNTFIPDESFFQTILSNSPFKDRITRDLTFTYWLERDTPHPELLDDTMLQKLWQADLIENDVYGSADIYFARKFNEQSKDLIERIHQSPAFDNPS